jgi:hypothetical protein
MIRQAFQQVGLGLPTDGSRDHEIKMKDFPDVQVGNWMDWQPQQAIKGEGEELQGNLTLEEVEILASKIPIGDDDDIVDFEETIVVDVEQSGLGIASFIRLIKGGTYNPTNVRTATLCQEGTYKPGGLIAKGGLIGQFIRYPMLCKF